MANGGGRFNDFNKRLNGVYTRFITHGQTYVDATNGIVAAGIISDWAPDNQIFVINKDEFESDPVKVTGYTYTDPHNDVLREVFSHAVQLYTYRLNKGGRKAKANGVGEAKYIGTAGNNIQVSVLQNVVDETKYDVTTLVNGLEKDIQTVAQGGVDEITLTKGTEKPGTAVETADASFTFADNQITVQFTNVPEGYKPSVRIKGQVGILAFTPGRMEDTELQSGNKHIISYYPGAAINGEMTVEAVLTKDKINVLKSCTYTCQLKEDVIVGADGSLLEDNDYVVFYDGILEPNAGYTFEGGSSGDSVTVDDYNNFLTKLEGRSFNNLYYDGTDDAVKALFAEYTHRLRDERGLYFQTVLSNYPTADYEGIISVYNGLLDSENVKTPCPWLAGLLSSLELSQEATNTTYDGILNINADISQSKMEVLSTSGQFFFHQFDLDEVRTYEDVNTLTTFTEEKDYQASQNKVIRTVDYIHNEISRVSNRLDIGKLANDDNGRNILWSRIDTILKRLVDVGAIETYEPGDIRVLPITGQKYSVEIQLDIVVKGTIRKIYITTNIY